MGLADEISVAILVADYAAADASKKLNILGGAWQITGTTPTGFTPGQALVVIMQVPARYRGEQFALSVTLVNDSGDPVMLPGPAGPTGEAQAIRIAQLIKVEPPMQPGIHIPSDLPSRVQFILQLQNGLPLNPNQIYRWVVDIDGNKKPEWNATFYVAGPPPAPVLG